MTIRSFALKSEIVTSSASPDILITPFSSVMLMTSSPLVALMTTVSGVFGVSGAAEVKGDLADLGPGQIADRDGVGAAQGDDVDLLDTVEVHRDGADVAGQSHAAAIGREVDLLV